MAELKISHDDRRLESGETARIVIVEGSLDAHSSDEFDSQMRSLMEGQRFLVLDMSEVSYINSRGMSFLIFYNDRLREAGGRLLLCGVHHRIWGIFESMGLAPLFTMVPDVAEAITFLSASPPGQAPPVPSPPVPSPPAAGTDAEATSLAEELGKPGRRKKRRRRGEAGADARRARSGRTRLGVFVGISSYEDPGIPNLDFARGDASELAGAFAEKFGFETLVLTDEEATRERVLEALESRLPAPGGQEPPAGSQLVFFFAGHGQVIGGEYYLHARRAIPGSPTHSIRLQDLMTSVRERAPCSEFAVILDSCRSYFGGPGGGLTARDASGPPPGLSSRDISAVTQRQEKLVELLYSCEQGQQSWEDKSLGHGVMTHYLLEAVAAAPSELPAGLSFDKLVCDAGDRMVGWRHAASGEIRQSPHLYRPVSTRQIMLVDPEERTGAQPFQVSVEFDRDVAVPDEAGLIRTLISIRPDPSAGTRPVTMVHLGLVLDVSASMKVEGKYPALLDALGALLAGLDDRYLLTVALFSKESEVVAAGLKGGEAAADVAAVRRRIELSKVRFGGRTNLAPALAETVRAVGETRKRRPDSLGVVYVLTDGQLHDGQACVALRERILDNLLEVHSFGFGRDMEYKHLKAAFAGCRGGTITKIERAQDAKEHLESISRSYGSVVGANVALRVRLDRRAVMGNVYRYLPDMSLEENLTGRDRETIVELGSIVAGRTHAVALEWTPPPDLEEGDQAGVEYVLGCLAGEESYSQRGRAVIARSAGREVALNDKVARAFKELAVVRDDASREEVLTALKIRLERAERESWPEDIRSRLRARIASMERGEDYGDLGDHGTLVIPLT